MLTTNVCNAICAKRIWNVIKTSEVHLFSVNWERKSFHRNIWILEYQLFQNKHFFSRRRYATSFVLERTTGNSFEAFYDAGRRGRSGEDCRQIYLECNEV